MRRVLSRLGTAIYPLNSDDAYDLDLACKLRKGVTKDSNTQEFLKEVVGQELEAYRIARGIKALKKKTLLGAWNTRMILVFTWI